MIDRIKTAIQVLLHGAEAVLPRTEARSAAIRNSRSSAVSVPTDSEVDTALDEQALSRHDFILNVLKGMNVNPRTDNRELDEFVFLYQGETFCLRYEEKSLYIHLFDLHWYEFDMDDIDTLSNVKKIVNQINIDSSVNLSYVVMDDGKKAYLATSYMVLLVPEIPNPSEFLAEILGEFFRIHMRFYKDILTTTHDV